MDKSKEFKKYIPSNIRDALEQLSEKVWINLNEINFILGQAVTLKIGNKRTYLGTNGIVIDNKNAIITSKTDISRIFELITQSSAYAYNRFINDGFLTLRGGHRVGIVGDCICTDSKIINVSSVNSFCFRIAHDFYNNANLIFDEIYNNNRINNCIIISPPGCGKTTLLRNIAFMLNNNNKIIKCTIIDERYEIAACYEGKAMLNIGHVTNVISGCDKSIAIPLVVRSMSPDVILVDELASQSDINSIKYALASGCSVIATTHGTNELNNEISFFEKDQIFDKFIILSSRNGPGTIEKIVGVNIRDT